MDRETQVAVLAAICFQGCGGHAGKALRAATDILDGVEDAIKDADTRAQAAAAAAKKK